MQKLNGYSVYFFKRATDNIPIMVQNPSSDAMYFLLSEKEKKIIFSDYPEAKNNLYVRSDGETFRLD